MTTCRCCGQEIARPGQALDPMPRASNPALGARPIWVDETLMACCNAAYEEAARRGSDRVGIAHLVFAAATHPRLRETFARFGVSPERLAANIDGVLVRDFAAARGDALHTSDALRSALEQAQSEAARQRRECATADDLLAALLFACSDRQITAMLSQSRLDYGREARPATSYRAARDRHERDDHGPTNFADRLVADLGRRSRDASPVPPREPSRVDGDRSWQDDAPRTPHEAVGGARERERQPEFTRSTDAGTIAGLMERLARQERVLEDLRTWMATNASANTAANMEHAHARGGTRHAHWHRSTPDGSASATSTRYADGAPPQSTRDGRSSNSGAAARSTSGSSTSATSMRWSRSAFSTWRRRRRLKRRSWRQHHPGERQQGQMSTHAGPSLRPMLATLNPADDDDVNVVYEGDAEPQGDVDPPAGSEKRFYLASDDEIIRAPSIGPRSAARLIQVGIVRVHDLLAADPAQLSARLGARHLTPARMAAWRDQARLVCTVPWLRGLHAQLMVGAGFNTLDAITSANRNAMCAAILRFATTREGQSILRAGPPPDVERIVRWIDHAQQAEPARAA